ncbi:MAG: hypothetical protein H0X37_16585 [Herpetosiphonaceae bacterium]|nr:hypothetical protein [Herpetosiphonaceae bacterium]
MSTQRSWQVLLLGGASGVGKTSVSYRLAEYYGVGMTELDDFQAILERMTSPEQYPVVHLWRTRPDEVFAMNDDLSLAHTLAYAHVMATALEPVIANHLERQTPLVLEGDFILPSVAVRSAYDDVVADEQVRAVFLYEDEHQLALNDHAREGEEQSQRAHSSWRYSEWLRGEAERLGLPTVAARPWETVLERVIGALGEG